ncbi:hypothetical protein [Nocardiopsis alkaliphila]|nr:hypothetical protein [Nocardiopsis alkaliphila]
MLGPIARTEVERAARAAGRCATMGTGRRQGPQPRAALPPQVTSAEEVRT